MFCHCIAHLPFQFRKNLNFIDTKIMKLFSIIIVLFCLLGKLASQPLSFRHITTAGGLLSDVNLRMAEDNLGRLWIAGSEGVNVFDGYEVISYSLPGTSGLMSNNVLQIYSDKQGTIWIATDKGIQYKASNSQHFIHTPSPDATPLDKGWLFFEIEEQLCLAANEMGLIWEDNTWKKSPTLTALVKHYGQPYALKQVNKDWWLYAAFNEVVLANINTGKVQRSFPFSRINAICPVGNDSSYLLGSFVRDSAILLNTITGKYENITHWTNAQGETLGGYFAEIMPATGLRIALAGRFSGLTILDLSQKTFVRYLHQPGNPQSLNASFTRRLFVTRNGTVFVSCLGLSYTSLKPLQFLSVSAFENNIGQRVDGVINGFGEDSRGQIWVATNSHLVQWGRQTGTSKFYVFKDRAAGGVSREIRAIQQDGKGRIWAGSFVGGLGVLEGETFRQISVRQPRMPNQLPGNNITAIVPLSASEWMICCMEGFALFNPVSEVFTTYYEHPVLATIAGNTTYHMWKDSAGNCWFAQAGKGIWRYNTQTQHLQQVDASIMPSNTDYYNITGDNDGRIYVSSINGVAIVDTLQMRVITHLGKEDGLATNLHYGVVTDNEGNIWMAGNRGLARYHPIDSSLRSFDAYDGVLQSNHKVNSFFKSSSGELFFGGEDGFNHFYPMAIRDIQNPFGVQVSRVEFPDMHWVPGSNPLPRLPYHSNHVTFHFLTTDFMLAPYMQYRYRLAGFDTGWVEAGRQRLARYTNLAAGNYAFAVEASADGKKWVAAPYTITFSIRKAWWQTWYFRISALVLAAGIVYGIFYARLQKMRKQDALNTAFEQKMAKVQMNLLRAQMNPHFIYNSLNSINSFILKNDRQNASGYLTKFSRLMRLILENSRSEWVTLENELKAIELYIQLEALRFNYQFSYSIEVDEALNPDGIVLPPMLLQPYIENAIWHGLMYREQPGGHLEIKVSEIQNKLSILIQDNGIGRKAAEEMKSKTANGQRSFGLKITDERLQMVNQNYNVHAYASIIDKYDNNGMGIGTEVTLTLNKISAAL